MDLDEWVILYAICHSIIFYLFSGGENVGKCLCDIRYPMGSVPRNVGLQHIRTHAQLEAIHGPLVPHVCKNMHLHQLVSIN